MDAKKRVASPPVDARRTRARTNAARAPPALDIAKHLECSICMSLYHDPCLLAASGQTYDLDCLLDYLGQGHTTCPMSRTDIKNNPYATPNVVIRSMVADYIEKHPGAGELTPRQSFEPILLLDPKIRKQAEIKALVKRLQEAVEVEVQVEVMKKLFDGIFGDMEAAQMLATIPDALPLLVRFLSSEREDCRFYAAGALADIALVAECRSLIVIALIKLTSLLAPTESDRVRAEAARAIANVANNNEEARRLLLDMPDLTWSIAQCLSSEDDYLFEKSVFALANLAYDNDFQVSIRIQGVLPNLVRGMRHGTVRVRRNSTRALCNLAKHARNKQMIFDHPDVLTLLVQCLHDADNYLRWQAVTALAHFATDRDSIRTAIAVIPDALLLLIQLEHNDPSEKARKDAKWALGHLSKTPAVKTKIERLKEQQQQ